MEQFSLVNKVAIVTGALGLLGKNHCEALAEAGANVIVADLDENECKQFAENLSSRSIGCYLDVTDKNSINTCLELTQNSFNKVDILVNNAAINDMVENPNNLLEDSKFENYSLDNWNKSIEVNLTGTFLCSRIIGASMQKNKYGNIINIASTYGIVAPNQDLYINRAGGQMFYKSPAYSVTKAAIISFTKYLAAYWAEFNIRVNCLSPGGVKNNQPDDFIEKYSSRTPLKRMAEPNDYKGAIVYLASDATKYMTGENLVVDGGWTIW
ncbi:MAG: SDR family oxidoreductase [Ignavibacteriales bacterium]|nr:SDR family oxidoreductase [Ignavibacteriales bacterium]